MGNRMSSVPLSNSGPVPEFFEETDRRDRLICRTGYKMWARSRGKVPSG